MSDPKPTGHDRDRSGVGTDEQADALYIANQTKFAKEMIAFDQKRYSEGKTVAGDGALEEAERALRQATEIANGLNNPDPGLEDKITGIRKLLSNLKRPL